MELKSSGEKWDMPRRDFLKTVGVTAAGMQLSSRRVSATPVVYPIQKRNMSVTVRGAFVYPPTAELDKAGYYSWPGSSFDAEGRQKMYMKRIEEMEDTLGMRIDMDSRPITDEAGASSFIADVKESKPDGLLLIPFKKGHWDHVVRITEEVDRPTVVLATLGVLLVPHVRQLHKKPGVFMISSPDNLDAVEQGMKMIRTARWMRDSCIVNITGKETKESQVPVVGTLVKTIPHQRFYDLYKHTKTDEEVKKLAERYLTTAKQIVEPTEQDVIDAAKTYFVLKRIIEDESADGLMMNCLPGLMRPHQHVPPCMGYMTLRDEGVPMGCESDLDATLTLMLLQYLFDRPGFQHNPSVDTEKNHYFCAHCTSASKMNGLDADPEPFILRSHAEAGWGCVPRVLMRAGQAVTIAKYLSSKSELETPEMLVYSGEIVGCPPIPPTGGCRTNVEATINELDDVVDLQGHHLNLIYGDYAEELERYCQLHKIKRVI